MTLILTLNHLFLIPDMLQIQKQQQHSHTLLLIIFIFYFQTSPQNTRSHYPEILYLLSYPHPSRIATEW